MLFLGRFISYSALLRINTFTDTVFPCLLNTFPKIFVLLATFSICSNTRTHAKNRTSQIQKRIDKMTMIKMRCNVPLDSGCRAVTFKSSFHSLIFYPSLRYFSQSFQLHLTSYRGQGLPHFHYIRYEIMDLPKFSCNPFFHPI